MSNPVLDGPLWHQEFLYFNNYEMKCHQRNKKQVKLELLHCKILSLIFFWSPGELIYHLSY